MVDSDAGDGHISKVSGRERAPQALQRLERVNRKQVLRIRLFAPGRRHGSSEVDVDAILFVGDSLDGDEFHLGVEGRTHADGNLVVIAVGKRELAGPRKVHFERVRRQA